MAHVFTYGSLMFRDVWERVVRNGYAASEATVSGHIRLGIADETYPALVPGLGKVTGVLYFDVCTEDLLLLDRFEGDEYDRITLPVRLADGEQLNAETYVFKTALSHRLTPHAWCVDTFRRDGIHTFMSQYVGFSSTGE